MSDVPFKEIALGKHKIRVFTDQNSQDELNWHMDHNDRVVTVLEAGDNWGIQFDNELPKKIKKGDKIFIPGNFYHRVILGDGKLAVLIKEVINEPD